MSDEKRNDVPISYPPRRPSSDGLCANCRKRPGTIHWGDMLAFTHGFATMWCEICALEAQLGHARERAALIPELEAKLKAARS